MGYRGATILESENKDKDYSLEERFTIECSPWSLNLDYICTIDEISQNNSCLVFDR